MSEGYLPYRKADLVSAFFMSVKTRQSIKTDVRMSQLTRQELYDKIKATSKDEYILSEMQRLGYWETDQPTVAESLIKRRGELQRELNALHSHLTDPQATLKAIHQERMAAARQRRIDTKVKREVTRFQRATDWHTRQQQGIQYLGDATHFQPVTADMDDTHAAQLQALGLPVVRNALALAQAMGVTLNELRFLTFTKQVAKIAHYQRFALPKKTGGVRVISAPMPRLKRLQYWVLDNVLQPLALTDAAHGFVTGRSIVTNAQPHVGQAVVINLDLQDFFPTVSYPRIQGVFAQLGYNAEVASLLALLCSEPRTQTVAMDGQTYHLNETERFLPQGAPTSPMLSNLICRQLDKRLQGLAQKYGFVYTRYADDLTFSSAATQHISTLLHWVNTIVVEEGFTVHPNKTHVMRRSSRQEVTGIVVNEQLSLNRSVLKQFRALLFQIEKDGYAGKTWGKGGNLLANIKGFAHYIRMVNPEKGQAFLAQIAAIQQKYGTPHSDYSTAKTSKTFRTQSARGELPLANQTVAAAPSAPQLADIIHHRDVLELVQQALGLGGEA